MGLQQLLGWFFYLTPQYYGDEVKVKTILIAKLCHKSLLHPDNAKTASLD
jgi:hypothetical protein